MDILNRLYERWNAHDIEGVQAFFTDDSVYRDQTMDATFHGPQELGRFMADTFVAIPDLNFELTTTMETDTHVAGEALMKGTWKKDLGPLPATGREFVIHYAIFGERRADRITRLTDYWNLSELTAEL